MKLEKILLIIPAYNEQDNILDVCNVIKKYNDSRNTAKWLNSFHKN